MNDLLKKKCAPCEGGILPLDKSEIDKYQKKIDGWAVSENKKKSKFLEFIIALITPNMELVDIRKIVNVEN